MCRHPPPNGLLLQLLPLSLVAVAVLRPCRTCLAIGRWSGAGEKSAAKSLVPGRSSSPSSHTRAEDYLSSQGFSDDELSKIKARYKIKFDPDLEKTIKPFLRWFSQLGLTDSQVHKIVVACPSVFRTGLKENGTPVVRWSKELGMDDSQVAKTVTAFPRLMGDVYNLGGNFKPKVKALRRYAFTDQDIVKVLLTFPALLTLSKDRLAQRLSVLQASGVLKDNLSCDFMKLTNAKFAARFKSA
mmetsp:Transcript_66218/g.190327  ORF Transcript_66218/g.190327 Transcript_66218/m.190327 type:complete len:242 (-) Transcript_66218:8-733(-)